LLNLKYSASRKMHKAGVSFRIHGKIYDFDPGQLTLKPGDRVVVETVRGQEMGEVVVVGESDTPAQPLKPVLRLATEEDKKKSVDLKVKEQVALEACAEEIVKLALPMKLISAEYSLDEAHLTVYFSAEGRIDFRELVRELGHKLHVRVELRQIGPRDEAKILGGYGRCGRELCCARFLTGFNPVSIKMAKTQDLPLNPMKISGVCGRLLCCLGYECEQYRQMKEKMPKEGTRVVTDSGVGVIVGQNAIGEKVMVQYETGARLEIPLARVKILEPPQTARPAAPAAQKMSAAEPQAAQALPAIPPQIEPLPPCMTTAETSEFGEIEEESLPENEEPAV
jgi:cell fate regulator YaaT (PSP1 superfamily)